MIKNVSQLTHKIEDKVYQFVCDHDSTIENIKESLFQFLKYVGQIEDAIKVQQQVQKPQNPHEMPVEEKKEEQPKVEGQ